MSVTHTRTHIFTLSMVRIKELFIFSLKKKMSSLALCPAIMSETLAEYLRNVYCYSQEYPSGLVSLACSRYWKQYLSMPAYGESEAL